MHNPDPTPLNLLYLSQDSPKLQSIPQSQLLLLIPNKGISGTLYKLSEKAQTADSIQIPFPKMDQPTLKYIIDIAIDNSKEIPSIPEYYITKSWLQYFRAIVLKLSMVKIATELSVHHQTYRRWEGPIRALPPLKWTNLLWRWWASNLEFKGSGPLAIRWTEITTPEERRALTINRDPLYWHRKELHRLSSLLLKETENDSDRS